MMNWHVWLQHGPISVCTNTTNAEMFVSRIKLNWRYKYVLSHHVLHASHFHSIARFQVGQNIYIPASSADTLGTSDWNEAVTAWYDEVQDMNPADVPNFQ